MPAPSPRRPRVTKETAESIGNADEKSRQKAKAAAERSQAVMDQAVASGEGKIPLTGDGRPMARILVGGAELIPHGQYANISCGPAVFELWVDPLADKPVSEEVKAGLAQAANEMFDALYADVLSVQRALIQTSIEEQAAAAESK